VNRPLNDGRLYFWLGISLGIIALLSTTTSIQVQDDPKDQGHILQTISSLALAEEAGRKR
jgi:hypothetical protein